MLKIILLSSLLLLFSCSHENNVQKRQTPDTLVRTGAEQMDNYINLLKNRRVALMVNQSSLVGKTHLLDTLLSLKINVVKIFVPEHGFRGNTERGKTVGDYTDRKTGVPVVSLYGKKKQPSAADLQDVDIVVYDLQDVGVRFFTYISSLYYLMQACAENDKILLVLDRPNPNGDYVAGPVLDTARYRSFVGMLPLPVVYGLTPAELALMINGEDWLNGGKKCKLKISRLKNYTHHTHYSLPVKPSPNLLNDAAVRLYPSLCFFEATDFSVGRGTDFPFQVVGYPDKRFGNFTFTPRDIAGVQTNPVQEGKLCYGVDLRKNARQTKFTLKYVIKFYHLCDGDIKFFKRPHWFDLLMGNSWVRQMIEQGKTEAEIKQKWQLQLSYYQQIRKKYLLYDL